MPCRIYKLDCQEENCEGVWCLSFQEGYLSLGWCGNLDSSMVKSAKLEIRGLNPGPGSIFLLKI